MCQVADQAQDRRHTAQAGKSERQAVKAVADPPHCGISPKKISMSGADKMKRHLFIVLAFLFAGCATFPPSPPTWSGKCVAVVDDDTITVMHCGRGEKIRLNGIDAPERGQDFSRKAKRFLSNLVFGWAVTIRPVTTDRFGRTAPFVDVGGLSINREIIRAKYAWVFQN